MATMHPLTTTPALTPRRRPGVRFVTLALLATLALSGAAARLAAPQALGVLDLVGASFAAESRADFAANPATRFAPQRPLTQPTGHTQSTP